MDKAKIDDKTPFAREVAVIISDIAYNTLWRQDKLGNGAYFLPLGGLATALFPVAIKDGFALNQ